jgi:hypothetical protein
LPNGANPYDFNEVESDWRFPGMIVGSCTLEFGAGSASDPVSSKTVQLVRTDSTMTTAPFNGASAWWSDQATYKVTTSPTALGRGRIAGVFLNAVTPGRLGLIQYMGRHPQVKFIDGVTAAPTAAGLIVIPSATAAKADCLAAGSAATYPQMGKTAGAYDAVNTVAPVDLNIPQVT